MKDQEEGENEEEVNKIKEVGYKIVEDSPKGRFSRFNEEIGSGSYKTVYRAIDNDTGCEVAWNVVKTGGMSKIEKEKVRDEIMMIQKLMHPNIIHFIKAWHNKEREEVIFITEIMTGGSLKQYLKKIRSPHLRVIKQWCRDILNGLHYLHTQKPYPVIHRDLKCDNIFVSSSTGDIRIGDLGLSTFMRTSHNKTVLGTPQYMAPELFEERYGPTVDIYSFGLCLLEMCTHSIPYSECKTPVEVYRKVTNGIKPLVLERILDKEVKEFIELCLAPVDQRPYAEELLAHPFIVIDENDDRVHQPIQLKPEELGSQKTIEIETPIAHDKEIEEIKAESPPSQSSSKPITNNDKEEAKNPPLRTAEQKTTEPPTPKEIPATLSRAGSKEPLKETGTLSRTGSKEPIKETPTLSRAASKEPIKEAASLSRAASKEPIKEKDPPPANLNRTNSREPTKEKEAGPILSRASSRDERRSMPPTDFINLSKIESLPQDPQETEITLSINIGSKDAVTGKINRIRLDFVFNLNTDTPDGVAEEMVSTFNLRPSFIPKIAQVIREKIDHCNEDSTTVYTPISSGMGSRNSSFENIVRDFKSYGIPSPSFSSGNTSPIEIQAKDSQHREHMKSLMNEMNERQLIQIPPFKNNISRAKQDNDPEDIKLVQMALNSSLGTRHKADGIFGKKTEALVKRFQEEAGMLVNGVVNKTVWDQLMMNYERKKRWEKEQARESSERRKANSISFRQNSQNGVDLAHQIADPWMLDTMLS